MHLPSERVRRQMLFEPSFLWFVPSEGSDTHAILVKANSNILRSIINGVKVQLFCAVNKHKGEKHLCLALRVYDDAAHPQVIFKVQIDEEEHLAFWEILKRKSTPLFFYDELCQCVAWTECEFAEKGAIEISQLIGNPEKLYAGKFNENTLHSMNCMDHTIDHSRQFDGAEVIQIVDLEIKFNRFETWEIFNYSVEENHKFEIKANEGEGFEQRVWTALESIFPLGIYKSPQVLKGASERELIDVLCLSGDNMLLIEAKAMSVFIGNSEKNIDRKVSNLQKQVDKALGQLEGAIKQIRKKSKVLRQKNKEFDDRSREIKFTEDQTLAPHAVVIVSELLPYGDWSRQSQRVLQLSRDNQALFQIIDLSELMKIVVASSKSTYDMETMANAFDYYLSERFDAFVKSKNIFIKVKFDN